MLAEIYAINRGVCTRLAEIDASIPDAWLQIAPSQALDLDSGWWGSF